MTLTPAEIAEIKAAIEERIREIEASLPSLEDTAKPVEPDVSLGRLTRMDAMQIQQMQEANLQVARANIERLKHSLQIINTEQFGRCRYCKNMIGLERLKALPESTMCINCAEKFGR
ncbi:MAG: TraR/DksA C4-type zinc finger protein [Candidatus Omnitrophica bacterium]|nr:TraR/DksA C4-type zinc finger protein [Candidatus Omnitrophota bacterium]MCB9721904.1 TraR/DksA C4-type zinc finger protein [Candidatus Omnitrophota bacterium]